MFQLRRAVEPKLQAPDWVSSVLNMTYSKEGRNKNGTKEGVKEGRKKREREEQKNEGSVTVTLGLVCFCFLWQKF